MELNINLPTLNRPAFPFNKLVNCESKKTTEKIERNMLNSVLPYYLFNFFHLMKVSNVMTTKTKTSIYT